MVKSKAITYVLWLFGGLLGLHHFYLGRDKQAFLWFSTFGIDSSDLSRFGKF
jgi:DnaJ family protein C protein 22